MTYKINIEEHIDTSVMLEAGDWSSILPDYQEYIDAALAQVITETPEGKIFKDFSHLELSIVLADDEKLQELNGEYRKKDKATNILSFPLLDKEELELYFIQGADIPKMPFMLGDIIISLETLRLEALQSEKKIENHFIHLMIHGVLHLLGYDHIQDEEAEFMESCEVRLLNNLNIKDPYKLALGEE